MKYFSGRRTRAIFFKELKHILRDPFTLIIALLLPLLIVLILGNSIEFNIRKINMVYTDHDNSFVSRRLIETFGAGDYFRPYKIENPDDAFDELVSGQARVAAIIPPNFGREFDAGDMPAPVQILIDGSNNASILAVMNYINTINRLAPMRINDTPMDTPVLRMDTRYMFNPELNSRWFSVPGLGAVIIALVAIMLTTLTICREWERGSMEMLLSTPVRRMEIILGKVAPYAILSLVGAGLVFVVARMIFGVPFVGNFLILFGATVLFILGYLAIGLLISVSTHKQEVAIQYAIIVGLLPTVVLSGFIFPVEYMTRGYRIVSHLFPASFYIDISRDQFLKGSSFYAMWPGFAAMAAIAVVLIILSLVWFKRSLE